MYQYFETDWEYLRRVASTLNTVLTADYSSPYPKFCLGVPDSGRESTLTDIDSEMVQDFGDADCHGHCYFEFEYSEPFSIGDNVTLEKHGGGTCQLVVTGITSRLELGVLRNFYRAEIRAHIKRHPYENKKIKGVSFKGTVLDVNLNHIKAHLEIDPEQDIDKAHWYPMSYESNQVWHVMPHVGEKVNICILDEHGTGIGMADVRGTTGRMASTPSMSNPKEKCIETKWGKTLALREQSVELDTQTVNISMGEDSIYVFSNDSISIATDTTVNFGHSECAAPAAGGQMEAVVCDTKNIQAEAEELMTFKVTGTQASFELTDIAELHSLTDRIKFSGRNRAPMALLSSPGQEFTPPPPPPPPPVEEPPENKRRGRWNPFKIAAAIVVAVAIVAVAVVAAPFVLAAAGVAVLSVKGAVILGCIACVAAYTASGAINEIRDSDIASASDVVDYFERTCRQLLFQRYTPYEERTVLATRGTFLLSILFPP